MSGTEIVIKRDLCPYIGLRPYKDDELSNSLFFGRTAESRRLSDNVLSSRLTLVYGTSGVGKSSLLNAGLAFPFRLQAEREREVHGRADSNLLVFRSWQQDPVIGLRQAAQALIRGAEGITSQPSSSLLETLGHCAELLGGTLVVVLDQFEEYFQYRASYRDSSFEDQFSELVRRDLPINFLVAIREDAMAWLDVFKGKIPNLFENYLRMQHLTAEGARDAIELPLAELRGKIDGPVECEAGLADAVIQGIRESQRRADGDMDRDLVPAPYLQIVMTRLWATERDEGSKTIRKATLEKLEGVQKIYEGHFRATLQQGLDQAQLNAATQMFEFLVTPSGRKVFQTAEDLKGSTGLDLQLVRDTLTNLRQAAVLTTVPAPGGATGYEFAHDVLAAAARKWWENFDLEKRLAEEQRKADEQQLRVRQLRRYTIGLTILIVIGLGALGLAAFQYRAAKTSQQQALDAASRATEAGNRAKQGERINLAQSLAQAALAGMRANPNRALLLAMYAVSTTRSVDGTVLPEAQQTLREALAAASAIPTSELEASIDDAGIPVKWRPDGQQVIVASHSSGDDLFLFDTRSQKYVRIEDGNFPVAWTPDSRTLRMSHRSTPFRIVGFSKDASLALVQTQPAPVPVAPGSRPSAPPAQLEEGPLQRCRADALPKLVGCRDSVPLPQHGGLTASPGLDFLAIAGSNEVWFYRLSDTHQMAYMKATVQDEFAESRISWSPDGQYVAVLSDPSAGGKVVVYDGRSFGLKTALPTGAIAMSLSWSGDSRFLAFGTAATEIHFWNVAGERVEMTLRPQEVFPMGIGVSEDSRKIFVAGMKEAPHLYSIDGLLTTAIDDLMNLARKAVHGALAPTDCQTLFRQKTCPAQP